MEFYVNEFVFFFEDVDRLLEKYDELKVIGLKYFDFCE